eukprot:TRINITY_DN45594_c0_g1_i1.p1 TRINITY_DN45594_c0_g1~~TRINITY_DN45594_c0_g1_i1.p1  ORF type:complete len:197 (+),score=39.46 TRINITY_DN45594_c0_g1_i1:194-784(+)
MAASRCSVVSGGATCKPWGSVETVRAEPFPVLRSYLQSDGTFPNNERYPLLVYQGVWKGMSRRDGEAALLKNGWTSPWAWGVFDFHHYHSTAWEALLCVAGSASIQFGGPGGPELPAAVGDLILIPPGVAHKQMDASGDFLLLGSYPNETPTADTVRGAPSQQQQQSIEDCPVPACDPIFGRSEAPWGDNGLADLF